MVVSDKDGIPAHLTIEKAREWVTPRISARRLGHVEGVARVARELSLHAGRDPFMAELGGWLHDACKEHKDKQLVEEARQFGLPLHPIEEANGHLLHGPIAACICRKELGITSEPLLNAIAEHTLGAVNMANLSQILFLADCLEESRPSEFTAPIWKALGYKVAASDTRERKLKAALDMENAILVACDLSLAYLLEDKKLIHPKTVDVRNWYLNRTRERENRKQ